MWLFILYLEHIGVDNNANFPRNKTQRFEFQISANESVLCFNAFISVSEQLDTAASAAWHIEYIYIFSPELHIQGLVPKANKNCLLGIMLNSSKQYTLQKADSARTIRMILFFGTWTVNNLWRTLCSALNEKWPFLD